MQQKSFHVSQDIMATNGQRFTHYILDLIFEYLFVFVLFFAMAVAASLFGGTAFLNWMTEINQVEEIIIMIIAVLLYTNLTEIFLSRTLAKFVTGTIVVMQDGSRPDRDTIMIRSVCRLIPFDHFSFLGTPSRGWHDSLSNTYVVNKKMLEAQLKEYNKVGFETEQLEIVIDSSNETDQTAQ